MNDIELLDAAKEITRSDSETARRIGSTQQVLCGVRNGRRELSAAQAAQIAELIGKPWIDEAFPRLAKKEKSAKAAHYWKGKLGTLKQIGGRAALGVLLAITLAHGALWGSPAYAAEPLTHCILCEVAGYILTCVLFSHASSILRRKNVVRRKKWTAETMTIIGHTKRQAIPST